MVNPVGRMISEVDWAYLSGLFDGDGAIMAFVERHREKKFGFRVRVIIKVTQKDPKVLYWIKKKSGIGNVIKNRTTFECIVRDQKQIIFILTQLGKYLRVKAKQATIALDILHTDTSLYINLEKMAKLADALSEFNVRSKGRKKNFSTKIKEFIPRND